MAWAVYENDSYNLYGQKFDADGNRDSSVFIINTEPNGYTHTPTLLRLSNGKIAAVWTGTGGTDTSLEGIQARLFGDDHLPTGNQFTINTYISSRQVEPAAAALTGGGMAVAWKSVAYGDDTFSTGVYGRVFSSEGAPVCPEFLVNTYTGGRTSALFGPQESQETPTAAGLSNGDFVMAWESYQDGDAWGVYGQRFGADCSKKGTEFRINTSTAGNQLVPRIAALDGGFVVTWQSTHNYDVSGTDSMARIYSNDGTPLSAEFSLSDSMDGTQATPFVAPLADGEFVGLWKTSGTDGGSGYGVSGRIFKADGTPASDDFQLNIEASGEETDARAAPLDSGGFWAVWQYYSGWETQQYGLVRQRFGSVSSDPRVGVAWKRESNPTGGSVSYKVGGFNIVNYRYTLDEGNQTQDIAVSEPLALTGLTTGTHHLSILGRNASGDLQSENQALSLSFYMEDGASPNVVNIEEEAVVPTLNTPGYIAAAIFLGALGAVSLRRFRLPS